MRSLMISKSLLVSGLLAVASAIAQDSTRIDVEISHDESNWAPMLIVTPGDLIHLRVRVTKEGTRTVLGFGSITFQPTISPWPTGSNTLSFTNPDTGDGVPDLPGLRGRILPFASPSMTSSSFSGVLTSHEDAGPALRFAGAHSSGLGNQVRGIACSQPPLQSSTNFNSNSSVIVFKTSVRISPDATPLEYLFDVPAAGIWQSRAAWYVATTGAANLINSIFPRDIHPAHAYVGGNPCTTLPVFVTQPSSASSSGGRDASFHGEVDYGLCGRLGSQWYHGTTPLRDSVRISGAFSDTLVIRDIAPPDAGRYFLLAWNGSGSTWSRMATLNVHCEADVDDGWGMGTPGGGVTIEDLWYYEFIFVYGFPAADLDDGGGRGEPDGGVTIEDLLYFLDRYANGC